MPSIKSMNDAARRANAERARRAALTPAQREAEDAAIRAANEADRQARAARFEAQRAANRAALLKSGVTPRAYAAAQMISAKRDRDFLQSITEQFGMRPLSAKQIAIITKIVGSADIADIEFAPIAAAGAEKWLGATA